MLHVIRSSAETVTFSSLLNWDIILNKHIPCNITIQIINLQKLKEIASKLRVLTIYVIHRRKEDLNTPKYPLR